MLPDTIRALQSHRKAQVLRRLELGPLWQETDLVFDGGDGRPQWRAPLARRLERTSQATGVPVLTSSGLRHTNLTLQTMAGISPAIIKERASHSSVNITLNGYVHPDQTIHREASDVLKRVLGD